MNNNSKMQEAEKSFNVGVKRENLRDTPDFFHATEALLEVYPKMGKRLQAFKAHIHENHLDSTDEALKALAHLQLDYWQVDSVIEQFSKEPMFDVIRRIYFRVDAQGKPYPPDVTPTIEEYAAEKRISPQMAARQRTALVRQIAAALTGINAFR